MTNAFEQGRTKMFPRHIFTTNDVLKRFLRESMQAHFYCFRKNIYVEVYISDMTDRVPEFRDMEMLWRNGFNLKAN